MKLILPLVIVFLGYSALATPLECQKKFNEQTGLKLRSFMKDNQLIHEGEEQNFPEIGVETRWELVKLVPHSQSCLAVMAICTISSENKECADTSYEVLGLVSEKDLDRIVPFEEIQAVPKSLVAKIGDNPVSAERSVYYVALSGKDAIDATKSMAAQIPYGGFSGIAVRGKKAAFDPNTNRNWQIQSGRYSLRRGLTAEVLDIQAFQLDGFDEGGAEPYWTGCHQPNTKYGECSVAPWGQAFIQDLLPLK